MTEYLNQAAYTRWLRNYNLSLSHYLERVDHIHSELNAASDQILDSNPELNQKIEHALDKIEIKLEEATPRNFNNDSEPLTGEERLTENFKFFMNTFFKMLGKSEPFEGIYRKEKNRIQRIHQEFNFKSNLNETKHMLDNLLHTSNEAMPAPEIELKRTEQV